ncbi:histidine kinase [Prevotella sp. E9-3]|uniref:sensor histidine kinase n=1 Tax=Prevotella sp. E9-3 TaxID=2913621 RepID=UPI001EDA469D|nr:histidine kinase [Prevotella sp. E9-3]UKK49309.1 histidine kinase [Prevotella sp. E9-3]
MQLRIVHKQEILVYVMLWIAMFLAPLISIAFHHSNTDTYPWHELFNVWLHTFNLFLAFLVHNILLAPLLVYKQRKVLYFSCIVVLISCFIVLQCANKPEHPHKRHFPERTENFERNRFEEHDDHRRPRLHHIDKPPFFFGQRDFISTVMLIMMLGMNVGVKLYFKQRDDLSRMKELEKENLKQQLEYLRYQINPHFLMNTLNNIHALVDIDSERAKENIVELSKIMRYALYEGSQQVVPLARDIDFLNSYIRLMRLRYTDKVAITVTLPDHLPDFQIPPMIFITFVENAFKHGVSYKQPSFIDIQLQTEGPRLLFSCRNSKTEKKTNTAASEGGVGLKNVTRRLQLIYGNRYHLNIDEQADAYNILLEIPL